MELVRSGVCSLQSWGPVPAWQQMRGQVGLGAAADWSLVPPGTIFSPQSSRPDQTTPWQPYVLARLLDSTRRNNRHEMSHLQLLSSHNDYILRIDIFSRQLSFDYTIRRKTVTKQNNSTILHTDVWFGLNFLLPCHPDTMSGHENDYYFLQDAWQGWLLGE